MLNKGVMVQRCDDNNKVIIRMMTTICRWCSKGDDDNKGVIRMKTIIRI